MRYLVVIDQLSVYNEQCTIIVFEYSNYIISFYTKNQNI